MRLIGCGLLALTFASSGWAAEHYVEVWNPPEARKPAAPRPDAAHALASLDAHAAAGRLAPARRPGGPKPGAPKAPVAKLAARHPRHAAQTLKARAHRPAAAPADMPAAPADQPYARPAPGKLTVMQPPPAGAHRPFDVTDIPRQFTPDGNVLRVGAHERAAEVAR